MTTKQPQEPPLLPAPSTGGEYVYDDGARIYPSWAVNGRWLSAWADGVMLTGEDDKPCYFQSPEEAAIQLRNGGEGPAAPPRVVSPPPPPKKVCRHCHKEI